jgi:hypothetical protein
MTFIFRGACRLAGTAVRAALPFFAKLAFLPARFLYRRPALKRALLALLLQQAMLLPFTLSLPLHGNVLATFWALLFGGFWTAFLAGLFWGMAAERASTQWDSIFALPGPASFLPWRWHALERKCFIAVLATLAAGLLLTLALEVPA